MLALFKHSVLLSILLPLVGSCSEEEKPELKIEMSSCSSLETKTEVETVHTIGVPFTICVYFANGEEIVDTEIELTTTGSKVLNTRTLQSKTPPDAELESALVSLTAATKKKGAEFEITPLTSGDLHLIASGAGMQTELSFTAKAKDDPAKNFKPRLIISDDRTYEPGEPAILILKAEKTRDSSCEEASQDAGCEETSLDADCEEASTVDLIYLNAEIGIDSGYLITPDGGTDKKHTTVSLTNTNEKSILISSSSGQPVTIIAKIGTCETSHTVQYSE